MRGLSFLLSVLIVLLMTACSGEYESEDRKSVIKETVYGNQFDTLHKAQQVEGTLLESARNRQQSIDASTSQ